MNGVGWLFAALGGLIIGIGFARVWNGKSNIKRHKIKGQKRQYYTMGEIWMQRIRFKFRGGSNAKSNN